MKGNFFCILLILIVILLMLTSAKAAEYKEVGKEVNASDILLHIESGDDVNLDHCNIVGKLNANKINFIETVSNPFLDRYLQKEYEGYIIHNEIKKTLQVIESNITIKNTTFKDDVELSYIFFNNDVNFSDSTFNNSANFQGSYFNNDVDFSDSTFNNSANFQGSYFNNDVDFISSTFNNYSSFEYSTFNNNVNFRFSTFNNSANFERSNFNNYADFWYSTFKTSADFSFSTFNNYVDFTSSTFNNYSFFGYSTFKTSAYFSEVTFNNGVDFTSSTFKTSAYFSDSTFSNDIDFSEVTFGNFADFSGATFDNSAQFSSISLFKIPVFYGVPETSENLLTDGKSCEFFMKSYNNLARYTDADNIYYNFRKNSMDKESISILKVIDLISYVTCGFGVRPLNTFIFGTTVIFLFSIIYMNPIYIHRNRYKGIPLLVSLNIYFDKSSNKKIPFKLSLKNPGIVKENDPIYKASPLDLFYYSIGIFTFISQGSLYPRDNFKKWVTIEGVIGWVTLGIFMATLTIIMIRP
jgi:hypothetical protein